MYEKAVRSASWGQCEENGIVSGCICGGGRGRPERQRRFMNNVTLAGPGALRRCTNIVAHYSAPLTPPPRMCHHCAFFYLFHPSFLRLLPSTLAFGQAPPESTTQSILSHSCAYGVAGYAAPPTSSERFTSSAIVGAPSHHTRHFRARRRSRAPDYYSLTAPLPLVPAT